MHSCFLLLKLVLKYLHFEPHCGAHLLYVVKLREQQDRFMHEINYLVRIEIDVMVCFEKRHCSATLFVFTYKHLLFLFYEWWEILPHLKKKNCCTPETRETSKQNAILWKWCWILDRKMYNPWSFICLHSCSFFLFSNLCFLCCLVGLNWCFGAVRKTTLSFW